MLKTVHGASNLFKIQYEMKIENARVNFGQLVSPRFRVSVSFFLFVSVCLSFSFLFVCHPLFLVSHLWTSFPFFPGCAAILKKIGQGNLKLKKISGRPLLCLKLFSSYRSAVISSFQKYQRLGVFVHLYIYIVYLCNIQAHYFLTFIHVHAQPPKLIVL